MKALSEYDSKIIQDILRAHLDVNHARVYIFGSRAKGHALRSSDCDLLIDVGAPLDRKTLGRLHEAFEESRLPFRVDIVDKQTIDEAFLSRIWPERVEIKLLPLSPGDR